MSSRTAFLCTIALLAAAALGAACSSGGGKAAADGAAGAGSGGGHDAAAGTSAGSAGTVDGASGTGGGAGTAGASDAAAGGGGTGQDAAAGDGGTAQDAAAGDGGTARDGAAGDGGSAQDAAAEHPDVGDTTRTGVLGISASAALARMTQLLWMAAPDAPLTAEASSGTYVHNGDLLPLAWEVLADPRARKGVGAFYRWWLGLDGLATIAKDAQAFPGLTADVRASMATETETFGVSVTLDEDSLLTTLYEAPYSYVDANVAAIYGLQNVTGTAFKKVDVNTLTRAGILTQPSVMTLQSLTARTSPTQRGVFILKKVLCQTIPASPPGVPPLTTPPPGTTIRQQLTTFTTAAECKACHLTIDPLGFAFEGLDAIGRSRDTDNGAPVDTSVTLVTGEHYTGARQLVTDLAMRAAAGQCMATQWLQFALGRPLTSADDISKSLVTQEFFDAGRRLRDLITGVLTSPAFLAP